MMRSHIAVMATMILLSACGPQGEEAVKDKPAQSGTTREATAVGGELATALRCWALTRGAYFQHRALAGETGNLPDPDEAVYTGWGKKLAILSHAKGMGFKAFNAMKDTATREVRIYSLRVDADHAAAVQSCIDTTPPATNEPDPSWPSDS